MESKGEVRRARKAAAAAGREWHAELNESGHLEQVTPRSRRAEYRHAVRMHRVARMVYEYDRDF